MTAFLVQKVPDYIGDFGAVEDDEGCPHIWMKKQL
mgnify:CR=1 FL=1